VLAGAVAPPLCPLCRRPIGDDPVVCEACHRELWSQGPPSLRPPTGVDHTVAALPYDGIGRRLLGAIKFGRMVGLAELGALMIEAALARSPIAPDPLVAVPPSPVRLALRGYDPAELLTDPLARLLGVRRVASLVRADRGRQSRRGRAERLARPPRFEVIPPVPARLIVVDDVLTTGATLSAAALALRRAGAERVDAAVLCRAPRGRRP
jgi:predicted amidophosphoribosyltransferase